MRRLHILTNEKGFSALITVLALGAVLTGFLLSLQMYVASRTRLISRIRLAYKYTFIMEDAAKAVIDSRLQYLSGVGAGGTCGASNVCLAGNQCAIINTVGVCTPTTTSQRCINGEACICVNGDNDTTCANYAANDFTLEYSDETMVALRTIEKDEKLQPAFDFSFFERLIPDFDSKYVAFVERLVFGRPSRPTNMFNEALAAANATYTFNVGGANPYGIGGTNPTANTTAPTSPYPGAGFEAYTKRDCTVSGGGDGVRCIEVRVCVSATKEPAVGSAGVACFGQRISRSFLWNHTLAPCAAATTAIGVPCTTAATVDNPQPGNRGHSSCSQCPWRDRF